MYVPTSVACVQHMKSRGLESVVQYYTYSCITIWQEVPLYNTDSYVYLYCIYLRMRKIRKDLSMAL